MFQAINTMITSVSDAQKNFVDTYFMDSYKEPALAAVEANRSFANGIVSAADDYVAEAKKAFKL